jgi:hypothetical protein
MASIHGPPELKSDSLARFVGSGALTYQPRTKLISRGRKAGLAAIWLLMAAHAPDAQRMGAA